MKYSALFDYFHRIEEKQLKLDCMAIEIVWQWEIELELNVRELVLPIHFHANGIS